jgi:pimeloyl-ACP methyl ester carboxylesterase
MAMDTLFRNSRRKLSQGLLFWREVGEGTPVVFLHGAWHDSSQWVSVLNSVSANFHCFAPDLLGFGESENPNIHYSIDLQVECLAELLSALKLEKVYLVGHSLGGWIAASYALKYPEQIYGVVLLAPEGVKVEGQEKYWQQMRRIVKFSSGFVKFLHLIMPLLKVFGWDKKTIEELNLRKTMLPYPIGCQLLFNRQQPEIEAELLDSRLYLLESPVLIFQGAKDLPAALAKSNTFARLISNAHLKMIAHAENNLPESDAGLVAEEIRDFIQGNWD